MEVGDWKSDGGVAPFGTFVWSNLQADGKAVGDLLRMLESSPCLAKQHPEYQLRVGKASVHAPWLTHHNSAHS